MKRYIFPDPLEGAVCELTPDSMTTPLVAVPDKHPSNGAACMSFDVPDSVPNNNGASLNISWGKSYAPYVLHGILDTITEGGGGFECDVFRGQKAGSVRPFHLDGHFCRYDDDNTEMLINDATGFRAFARYVDGEAAQLDAFVQSCVANRINMIRVAAMQDTTLYLTDPNLRYRIHPADHANYYELLLEFVEYVGMSGLYVDLICCTQTQTILPDPAAQVSHIQRVMSALFDSSALVSKVNEQYVHDNSIDGAALALTKPYGAKFLLSTGSQASGVEDALEPCADVIEYHTNDLSEWQRKGGHNSWEMGNRYNRAAYPSEETRTDKDGSLAHYEDSGKTEVSMCMASMIHTPEGKNADAFDFSLAHIDAHNRGVFDGGVNYRRGSYRRYDPPPDICRDYSMTVPGLGEYRWQVRY